jgi:hypothetical protein
MISNFGPISRCLLKRRRMTSTGCCSSRLRIILWWPVGFSNDGAAALNVVFKYFVLKASKKKALLSCASDLLTLTSQRHASFRRIHHDRLVRWQLWYEFARRRQDCPLLLSSFALFPFRHQNLRGVSDGVEAVGSRPSARRRCNPPEPVANRWPPRSRGARWSQKLFHDQRTQ